MMKQNILYRLLLLIPIFTIYVGCKKTTLPAVRTSEVTGISDYAALTGGDVYDDGGSPILARGVCWSKNGLPTLSDPHTVDGNGAGVFDSEIEGLEDSTTYTVRSYATNEKGTSFGNPIIFFTHEFVPPCSVYDNSIIFDQDDKLFPWPCFGAGKAYYGTYSISADCLPAPGYLYIEFSDIPKSGNYRTITPSKSIGKKECVVWGYLNQFDVRSIPNDTIYVSRVGKFDFSMSFCNLHLRSLSSNDTLTCIGNMRSDW